MYMPATCTLPSLSGVEWVYTGTLMQVGVVEPVGIIQSPYSAQGRVSTYLYSTLLCSVSFCSVLCTLLCTWVTLECVTRLD